MSDATQSCEETISKYIKIIKNALHLETENEKRTMIFGGPDCTVQNDESHVFRRKYNVGRQLKITEHGWLFGMVEDKVGGRLYLEMVKDRDKPTLQGIIKKHTETGTRIFSDCWKAYNSLSSNGFVHFTVNHKECFVNHQHVEVVEEVPVEELPSDIAEDAEDIILIDDAVDAHTNKIERCWREVKRGLLNQPICLLARNVNVEMFRYNYLGSDIPFRDKRDIVVRTVGKHQEDVQKLLQDSFEIYPKN